MYDFNNKKKRRLKITIESEGSIKSIDEYYEGDLKTFANTLYSIALSCGFNSDLIDQTINCEYNGWKYLNEDLEDEKE